MLEENCKQHYLDNPCALTHASRRLKVLDKWNPLPSNIKQPIFLSSLCRSKAVQRVLVRKAGQNHNIILPQGCFDAKSFFTQAHPDTSSSSRGSSSDKPAKHKFMLTPQMRDSMAECHRPASDLRLQLKPGGVPSSKFGVPASSFLQKHCMSHALNVQIARKSRTASFTGKICSHLRASELKTIYIETFPLGRCAHKLFQENA